MKKIAKILCAGLFITCVLTSAFSAEIKRNMTPAKSWTLYVPGKGNKKDVVKDLNKAGWQVTDNVYEHFSLVDSNLNGKKVLKLDTLGKGNDCVVLPLSGNEKKVTVIFKAKGAVNPDNTTTPYGLFFGFVQKGTWQSMIRHNSSNQIKGSKNTTRLNPENIVSDWHDYRWVFDIPEDASQMTAKCYIDGNLRHEDFAKNKDASDFPQSFDWSDTFSGVGNYLQFGENDNSTNGFSRYAYILVVLDEDVSEMTLEQLGAKVKADLVTNPEVKDADPPSKRPAKKPAGITILGPEVKLDDTFKDPSAVVDGKLNMGKLPVSGNKPSVIDTNPPEEKLNFTATVDPTGANGAYKTIAEAIEAVPSGSAIKVMPGLYYEKLKITKPGISLIGTNPETTIIFGYEADTGGIDGNLLVEVNLLPQNVKTEPGVKAPIPEKPVDNCYFNAANITFYNKGGEWNGLWGGAERRSIALALKGVDQCYLKNCIFLGQQDTLYWRSGRVYAENCYIQGTVDYICGGATVFFNKCEIYSILYENGGIVTAAAGADTGYTSTAQYANGYVFKDCKFTGHFSFEKASKKVTIARGTWVGGSATGDTVVGKNVIINCEMSPIFDAKGYKDWDSVNTAEKCFFREYKNTGNGASTTRPQLSDAEAKKLDTPEKVLGYKPVLK